MLIVRKTLTTILLEVTNEIIHEISTETVSKFRKKGISQTKNQFYFVILMKTFHFCLTLRA
jgi:hypothetical protein